jgi:hypothetical protein
VEEEEPHPHGQTHAPVLRDLIQLLHAKEAADHVTEGLGLLDRLPSEFGGDVEIG